VLSCDRRPGSSDTTWRVGSFTVAGQRRVQTNFAVEEINADDRGYPGGSATVDDLADP